MASAAATLVPLLLAADTSRNQRCWLSSIISNCIKDEATIYKPSNVELNAEYCIRLTCVVRRVKWFIIFCVCFFVMKQIVLFYESRRVQEGGGQRLSANMLGNTMMHN